MPSVVRPTRAAQVNRVWNLLDRNASDFDVLGAAVDSLSVPATAPFPAPIAIGLDTNALFRIVRHRNNAEIVDLLSRSRSRLVLPGQAVQEFWNNKLVAIESLGKKATDLLGNLSKEIDQIAEELDNDEELEALTVALAAFASNHKELTGGALVGAMKSMFAMLQEKSICEFVPRRRFLELGNTRLLTKTPPGFKDAPLLGDYYVWADFLLGLCVAGFTKPRRASPQREVVFVSEDRKFDWEVKGQPHPLLVAEIRQLVGATLRVLSVEELLTELRSR